MTIFRAKMLLLILIEHRTDQMLVLKPIHNYMYLKNAKGSDFFKTKNGGLPRQLLTEFFKTRIKWVTSQLENLKSSMISFLLVRLVT